MNLPDTYNVLISVSGAVDAKGAIVDIPAGSFTWEIVQTSGAPDTFGALKFPNPDKTNPVLLVAGVGGAKGYIRAILTLADNTKYYGQTEIIDIGVTEAVSLILTLGVPKKVRS